MFSAFIFVVAGAGFEPTASGMSAISNTYIATFIQFFPPFFPLLFSLKYKIIVLCQYISNVVRNQYNKAVDYDADKNDPERTLWKKIVDYVKENESAFFTKKGDWKKKIDITEKDIMASMEQIFEK